MTSPDIAIEEIRRTRHQISAECGHDPAVYVEHLRQLARRYAAEGVQIVELSGNESSIIAPESTARVAEDPPKL